MNPNASSKQCDFCSILKTRSEFITREWDQDNGEIRQCKKCQFKYNQSNRLIKLQPLPNGVEAAKSMYSPPCHISEHSIVFTPNAVDRVKKVFAYDIRSDQWKRLLHDDDLMLRRGQPSWIASAHDPSTNTLYLELMNIVVEYDMNTNTIIKRERIRSKSSSYHHMHCINDNLYFLRSECDKHWIVKIGEAWTVNEIETGHIGGFEGTSVHIPSRNMILLIGGMKPMMRLFRAQTVIQKGLQQSDGSWIWERVESNVAMAACNAVATADGKFVIVSEVPVGHRYCTGNANNKNVHLQYIHILDIDDGFTWRRSSIRSPLRSDVVDWKQMMFRTGSGYKIDVMVSGFVRRHYRNERIGNMIALPTVLKMLIGTYYPQELIHWVTDKNHVAMPLQEILRPSSSLSQEN